MKASTDLDITKDIVDEQTVTKVEEDEKPWQKNMKKVEPRLQLSVAEGIIASFPQLKVFNSVVLDDPRKTVQKGKLTQAGQAKYILVEMAGKFKYDL
jgi:hypothetical protein